MQVKKRFILLIILFIFVISTITFFLIINYLDPYEHTILGIVSLVTTFLLLISSFFSIVFYIFKKIYFRGEVFLFHVTSSFRQGFFLALFFLGMIVFEMIGAPLLLTGGVFFIFFLFIELFIQNLIN